jgi:DNA-binding NarL/FixJ family response regulator
LARISGAALAGRGQEQDLASGLSVSNAPDSPSPLSLREREVVALLATGKTNREIGSKLLISTRTVENHRARIMLKLDLHSLSDLVLYAVRNHFIHA